MEGSRDWLQVAAGPRPRPLRLLRLSHLMKKTNTTIKTLTTVHNATGCVGHLLRSSKGFRAFDRDDKEIGTYETAGLGLGDA
jgi:hypothetical protein